jgi:hypothetical protein
MRVAIVIITFLSFLSMIESRPGFVLPRNMIKNYKKSIINHCNYMAHIKVQDDEVYSCFKNVQYGCNQFPNYTKFADIRSECIKKKDSEFGIGIFIGLMFWVVVAIFGMY